MRNKRSIAVRLSLALWAAAALSAQPQPGAYRVDLPSDAPLALVSADWGASRATPRGGAMLLELHSTLQLKNSGARRIRAVSLLVTAQDATPGGRASVTVPSLDIPPGESFPLRIDLRLVRPLQTAPGAVADVQLDGVLFDDLSFYGANRMNARRAMLAWELEARRDRNALLAVLERGGADSLRAEMLSAMARLASQPRLEVQAARPGRATAFEPEHEVALAALALPASPVELLGGSIRLAGDEARAPHLLLRNVGSRPVRSVEVSWLVRDSHGQEYAAGTLPADVSLAPGETRPAARDGALRFSLPGGAPASVLGLTGFVSSVEFADGGLWLPTRQALDNPRLRGVLPLSGEQERLVELYRRKGLEAVVQQLQKLR
ncbi:MAG: hypothetical protein ACLQBJ_09625 [Bryobacteraceae bacterium]